MDPAIIGAGLAAIPTLAALTAVAGVKRARKKAHARAMVGTIDLQGSQRDAALLVALGYDPTKHRILASRGGIKGLRIVDDDGNRLAFFTRKQLQSDRVRKAWREAMRATQVVAR